MIPFTRHLAPVPRRLKIPPGARVLEIGSGGRPHPQATVLLDRYLGDASEREGRTLIRDQRPFLVADGEALPFADKSFDYCVCSHVLEHAFHPDRLLREMERVAHAGYIETPTELFDWMFSVPPYTVIHRWYVNLIGGELVLAPKSPETATHRFAHLLDFLRREDPYLERWMEKHPQLFTTQYEWSGTIRFRLTDQPVSAGIRSDDDALNFLRASETGEPFFWGTGRWGFKRWFYSHLVHPCLRKKAKRLLGRGR